MEPETDQKLSQSHKVLVEEIVEFIKLIKQFKYSNLAQNPQILGIYDDKDMNVNQRPTLWQTFIYSVRKFNEKPFDTGKSVFQIIFMVIFCSYYSPKVLEQIKSAESPNDKYQKYSESKKSKQRKNTFAQETENKIYDSVLKELNRKNFPSLRQWNKQNIAEIKESKNPKLLKQQIRALIQQVKTTKSIQTLEYIINTNWYLVIINSKKMRDQMDKNLLVHAMKKHSQFGFSNLTGLEYKIWVYLKQKFYINCSFFYLQVQKIKAAKLLNLVMKTFLSSTMAYEQADLRFYMHGLHKSAERCKNLFLADMIKSKCFLCEAERYSSNSIHKMRIYQCLSRKFLNAVTYEKKQPFQHAFVQQLKEKQKMKSVFDSQEEYELC